MELDAICAMVGNNCNTILLPTKLTNVNKNNAERDSVLITIHKKKSDKLTTFSVTNVSNSCLKIESSKVCLKIML